MSRFVPRWLCNDVLCSCVGRYLHPWLFDVEVNGSSGKEYTWVENLPSRMAISLSLEVLIRYSVRLGSRDVQMLPVTSNRRWLAQPPTRTALICST